MNENKITGGGTSLQFNKEASQALKGIAIILMLFHHSFREVSLYENYTISFVPFPEWFVVNIAAMCKICVSLFAFISGYGLFLSYRDKKTAIGVWALERYIKTFSGYWFIWIISAVITQFLDGRFIRIFFRGNCWQGLVEAIVDFFGIATLFKTPTLNGTWWYMSAAFVFIVLIVLLYEKLRDSPAIVLIGCIVFIRVLFAGHADYAYTGGNSIYSFISAFLFWSSIC